MKRIYLESTLQLLHSLGEDVNLLLKSPGAEVKQTKTEIKYLIINEEE